jgi:hypothetical protein
VPFGKITRTYASPDAGDCCKRSALKWVPLARNHH